MFPLGDVLGQKPLKCLNVILSGVWMMFEGGRDELPVSDFYEVLDYTTIFKNEEWWEAVVMFKARGMRAIGLYLWHQQDGTWKRKHKFTVRTLQEWKKVKREIDRFTPKLDSK